MSPASSQIRGSMPRNHWALATFGRALGGRFREGWLALDRRARRDWLIRLAIGFGAAVATTVVLTLIGRWLEGRGSLGFERELLVLIEARAPLDFHQAMVLQAPGSSVMLIPAALVAAWIANHQRRPLHALSLLAGAFAIKPIVMVGWWLWARGRPQLIEDGLAVPSSLHAFPSLHVAQVISFWGLLFVFWARSSKSILERCAAWALLAALLSVIVLSRLRLGAHWPSDVAAAVVIGSVWLFGIDWALRRVRAAPGDWSRLPR